MTKRIAGLYRITHSHSGQYYIGQSNSIDDRLKQHKHELRSGAHHNAPLQRLWTASGVDAFHFEIIEHAPSGMSPLELQRWLAEREVEVIEEGGLTGLCLNTAPGGIVATKQAKAEYEIERKKADVCTWQTQVLRVPFYYLLYLGDKHGNLHDWLRP